MDMVAIQINICTSATLMNNPLGYVSLCALISILNITVCKSDLNIQNLWVQSQLTDFYLFKKIEKNVELIFVQYMTFVRMFVFTSDHQTFEVYSSLFKVRNVMGAIKRTSIEYRLEFFLLSRVSNPGPHGPESDTLPHSTKTLTQSVFYKSWSFTARLQLIFLSAANGRQTQ